MSSIYVRQIPASEEEEKYFERPESPFHSDNMEDMTYRHGVLSAKILEELGKQTRLLNSIWGCVSNIMNDRREK